METGTDADRGRGWSGPGTRRETILAQVKGALILAGAALLATACSSSSSRPANPTIAAAQTFRLEGFRPTQAVTPGRLFEISSDCEAGAVARSRSTERCGPHTGVHLILVRDDLSLLIHR